MGRPGCNQGALPDLLQPFDHNLLTPPEAIVNHTHRPDRLAGLHRAYADFMIAADNRHLIASLHLRNGALRYQQRSVFYFGFDTHTSILARTQNAARIGKSGNDANRARARIDLPVGQQDFSFLSVDTAVSQDQFERFSEETAGVFGGNSIALLHEYILVFADRDKSLDGV